MCRYAVLMVVLICAGCSHTTKTIRKTPSTAVDTERLTDAIKKSNAHQDSIISDGKALAKDLPEDSRPPRIVNHATDTKTELAKANQTIDDLKAKETESQQIDEAKDKEIADLVAANEKLQTELDSSLSWFFTIMIIAGAVGIVVSIAVAVKIDKQFGAFGLILSVGSVVTGYFLRDFACWIPLIGAGCAAIGGVMFWRQHSKDQDKHRENDEVVRELVVTTADIQKHGWTKETHDRLVSNISEPTRDRVRDARRKHKITKVDLPIPLAPPISE